MVCRISLAFSRKATVRLMVFSYSVHPLLWAGALNCFWWLCQDNFPSKVVDVIAGHCWKPSTHPAVRGGREPSLQSHRASLLCLAAVTSGRLLVLHRRRAGSLFGYLSCPPDRPLDLCRGHAGSLLKCSSCPRS